MFKHALGITARSRSTKVEGIVTSRCQYLYGCNRYLLQPPVDKDGKLPDGWWMDEADLEQVDNGISEGVVQPEERTATAPGGPITRHKN